MNLTEPRSFLYVPGDRPDRITKAFASAADAVIIDLEDAVKPAEKVNARTAAVDAARAFKYFGSHSKRVWIRINDGDEAKRDIEAMGAFEGIEGLVLAKCDSAAALVTVASMVPDSLLLSPLLESARSLHHVDEILESKRGSACHLGEVDLLADLRARDAGGERLLQRARESLIFAVATFGAPQPIAGIHLVIDDLASLRASTQLLSELGFSGRALIHPSHCPVVNEAFTPTITDQEWARGVLAQLDEGASGAVRGTDGTMLDEAVARRARSILSRAD